ncbi:MAG: antibiotic biosynthesis monooxygenase [Eubacteriales bacterium]|nr:antibiotic biosynthesis monooxygenase [Eubacteriales bacterium]MDD3883044.1 antibiotic biosynthesis monooxygenase [Eubacteriales bacterium]MDD4513629.1 antibiotic biosynthesis monooxygenase [Eubacteriales bacterium]
MNEFSVLLVKYTVKRGMLKAFSRALSDNKIAELSRAEEGCEKYEYLYSQSEPDALYLNEVWRGEDNRLAHMNSTHFKVLAMLKGEYVEKTDIEKYIAERI